MIRLRAILCAAFLATCLSAPASADDYFWKGGANSNFSTAGNWSTAYNTLKLHSVAPADGDNLTITAQSSSNYASIVNDIAGLELVGLTFNRGGVTLTGNSISLPWWNVDGRRYSSYLDARNAGGVVSIGVDVNAGAYADIIAPAEGLLFTGRLSGSDSYLSGGLVRIAGNFGGGWTVGADTVRLEAGGSVATGTDAIIGAGSTFDLNGISATFGNISGSGAVGVSGGATLEWQTAGVDLYGKTVANLTIGGNGNIVKGDPGRVTVDVLHWMHTGSTRVKSGILELRGAGYFTTYMSNSWILDCGTMLEIAGSTVSMTQCLGGGIISLKDDPVYHTHAVLQLLAPVETTFTNEVLTSSSARIEISGPAPLHLNTFVGVTPVYVYGILVPESDVPVVFLESGGELRVAPGASVVTMMLYGDGGTVNVGSGGTYRSTMTNFDIVKTGPGTYVLPYSSSDSHHVDSLHLKGGTFDAQDATGLHGSVTTDCGTTLILRTSPRGEAGFADLSAAGDIQVLQDQLLLGGACTITGNVSGTADLRIARIVSPGSLTLRGVNTYAGTTRVNNSTLTVSGGSAIPDNSAVTLASSDPYAARLTLEETETIGSLASSGSTGTREVVLGNHQLTTGGNGLSTTFDGVISGANGTLRKAGVGTFTLAGSAPNTFSWGAYVDCGTLALAKSANVTAVSGRITASAGTLRLDADNQIAPSSAVFAGGGRVEVGSHTLYAQNVMVFGGGVMSLEGGVVTLGDCMYVNPAGTLSGYGQVDGCVFGTADGVIEAVGGGLTLGSASRTNGFQTDGTLRVGTNYITLNDADKAQLGSLTTLGDGQSTGMLMAMNGLMLGAGRTLSGQGHIHAAITVEGTARGDAGQGLIFRRLVDGNGHFEGNVEFWSDLAPGHSAGLMTFENATLNGALFMELGGRSPSDYDRFEGTGDLHLGGMLDVKLIDGFTPAAGDSFDLLDAGAFSGDFWSVSLPDLGPGLAWDSSRLSSAGELFVTSTVPEPATLTLLGLGVFGALGVLRRRTR